ncbi:MAG: hypothetical protein ACP5GX_01415 [Anaerolineae bacterium]
MTYHLHRDAFSEVYTYRYRLTDPEGNLQLAVTWPATGAALQPDRIFFEDAEGNRLAHLDWEDRSWWLGDRFHLFIGEAASAAVVIREHWNIVDRLLLHLPRYRIELSDGNLLEARGSRYGESFYEIFVLPADEKELSEEAGVWLGEVTHPPSGPTYIVRTESPLLTRAPLLMVAVVVVVDLWGLKKE